jgi:hypothetical protein
MNILQALSSVSEIVTTIESVTAHVNTAVELLTTASKENRDLTDAELNQIVARADLSRLSLAGALAG